MKFIFLVTLMLPLVFLLLIAWLLVSPSDCRPANVRNYKVRFDALKEKYYITNVYADKDVDIVGFFGTRKYYADRFKAELVAEKLNS